MRDHKGIYQQKEKTLVRLEALKMVHFENKKGITNQKILTNRFKPHGQSVHQFCNNFMRRDKKR